MNKSSYVYRIIRKVTAILFIGIFCLYNITFAITNTAINEKLSPPLSLQLEAFEKSYTVAAICKAIEQYVSLDNEKAIDNICSWANKIPNSDTQIIAGKDEVIIEVPEEGLAVRYFVPGYASVVTPYNDVIQMRTTGISSRLCRQIIRKTKVIENKPDLDKPIILPGYGLYVGNKVGEIDKHIPSAIKTLEEDIHGELSFYRERAGLSDEEMLSTVKVKEDVEEVNLGKLLMTRANVRNPWVVLKMLLEGKKKFEAEVLNKPPIVVKWGDKLFISEGNHRSLTAYLLGKKTIKAKIIEYTGTSKQKMEETFANSKYSYVACSLDKGKEFFLDWMEGANSPNFTKVDRMHMSEVCIFTKKAIKAGVLGPPVPVVARIVDGDGQVIVTTARNKYPEKEYGADPEHAEIVAIRKAEKKGFTDWSNATMYVNLQPCDRCERAVSEFYGFKRIVYGIDDRNLVYYNPKGATYREAYTEKASVLVKCDDTLLKADMEKIFDQFFVRYKPPSTDLADVNRRMMATQKRILTDQKEIIDDIQIIVLDADLWMETKDNPDPEISEFLFRNIVERRERLKPKKENVLLIVGETENCEKTKKNVIEANLYEEGRILDIDSVPNSLNTLNFTKEDKKHMEELIDYAEGSIEDGSLLKDFPIVARIVDKEGTVLAMEKRIAYNNKARSSYKHRANGLHAEIAVIRAAEKLGYTDWHDYTLYINLESCTNCAKACIEFYGFKRIVYGADDAGLFEEDQSRNFEMSRENNVAIVKCDDPALIGRMKTLFKFVQHENHGEKLRRISAEMLDGERKISAKIRLALKKNKKDDVQVCVFDADLWDQNREDKKAQGFMLRRLSFVGQNLNPVKKHVLVVVGEEKNCKEDG